MKTVMIKNSMYIPEILVRKITCQDMSLWRFKIMRDAVLSIKRNEFNTYMLGRNQL